MKNINLVAVGDEKVKKVALLTVLKGDPFPERYIPTIFEEGSEVFFYKNISYRIHFMDTLGLDGFYFLVSNRNIDVNVILLCFSLENRETFLKLTEGLIFDIKYYCKDAKIILIGLNLELRENGNPNHVTDEEAFQFCKEQNFINFIPCSAEFGTNINLIIPNVMKAVETKKTCKI